ELLVGASAALIRGRTELEVRRLSVACFEKAGYGCQFFRPRAGDLVPAEGLAPHPLWNAAYGNEALSAGRPIFRGATLEDLSPTHVFLPVGEGPDALLLLLA